MTKARTLADNFAADINGITAGTGITGGGTSGTVTVTNSMATEIDAKGDLVVGTGADTFSRLGVGANDTILVAASGEATGLKWAAPAGSGANWSLLNSGGTTLSGAATITVSGISGKDKIMILIDNATGTGGQNAVLVRLNTDTGNNYYRYGPVIVNTASYGADVVQHSVTNTSGVFLIQHSNNGASTGSGYFMITGCNSSGVKVFHGAGASNAGGGTGAIMNDVGGYYNSASTISSISLFNNQANFTAGTVFVYTSA